MARVNGVDITPQGDARRRMNIPGSTGQRGSLHVNTQRKQTTGAYSIGEIAAWDWEIPKDQLLAFEYHMLERWGIERLPKFDNW